MTAKQGLMLKRSSEGKSMRAIATIENMTYSNVKFHMNNARRALNAGTQAQATKLKLI
ncbi:LuxR C-terminal-related transcriptional regulator [Ensifer sp. D2-11]